MAGFKGRRGDGGQRGGARPARYGTPGSGGAPQPGRQDPRAYGGGQGGGYGGAPGGGYGGGPGGSGHPGGHGGPAAPYGGGDRPGYQDHRGAPAPSYDDSPGSTRAFTLGGDARFAEDPYADQGYDGGVYGSGPGPYGGGYDDGRGGYDDGAPYGGDNVATYRAGQASAPPAGPRLHWKELLSGIVLRPGRTFWQMRDHTVWGPALVVTFVYGLLAVFGFDAARSDVLNSTLTASVPWVLTTGVMVVLCGLTLGAVTNTLARQLGGDGAWAPTVGLAMLVSSLTDAPRLLFALFLGGGNGFVQLLGWLTWIACGALLTSMVAKSHDLPWLKALGACSIQLVALLMLFKLPLI
ncbi:Yip1 family protein [Actinacidiphila reveromycinica]|uniref:Yip1 family protein n=1 Tax=Actinacidiphila reveromycinica TaxID=659352 RepID=UPI001F1DEBD3|nr:Yip1 family protein [Streptomyces sp. SN-593]